MKKLWGRIIGLVVLVALCACGSQSETGSRALSAPAPVETAEIVKAVSAVEKAEEADRLIAAQDTELSETVLTPVGNLEAVPEPEADMDALNTAKSLIGEDVVALYAAIGEPISCDYAPSCLVDGEDGELYYEEFVVYTQRTASGETVYYVE